MARASREQVLAFGRTGKTEKGISLNSWVTTGDCSRAFSVIVSQHGEVCAACEVPPRERPGMGDKFDEQLMEMATERICEYDCKAGFCAYPAYNMAGEVTT
jgi:hypothetical protein